MCRERDEGVSRVGESRRETMQGCGSRESGWRRVFREGEACVCA
jgi:hypothetical protein